MFTFDSVVRKVLNIILKGPSPPRKETKRTHLDPLVGMTSVKGVKKEVT